MTQGSNLSQHSYENTRAGNYTDRHKDSTNILFATFF